MVKTWVTHGGKQGDKISELQQEIESLEKKEKELNAEIQSVRDLIFEKQNKMRELLDEQSKQDLLS